MSEQTTTRADYDTTTPPRVCRGCGCTDDDGCLVGVGLRLGDLQMTEGCAWVTKDWCSGCARPERRERGPVVDHRVPAPAQ